MSNAKAPGSQQEERNKEVIGIGTDGKPVNMDLWKYSLLDNGNYGLNSKENLQTDASAGIKAGYLGDFTDDGKIMGKIPQYISNDNGKKFIKVTDYIYVMQ